MSIEVEIEEGDWLAALPNAQALAKEAALAALEGRASGDVVLFLTGDTQIRALNAAFRGKDVATNVLAFPAAPSAKPHLGDVALAYGVCTREAQAQGKSLAAHFLHLTIHGVLHLLGYDHETDADAASMEALERALLAGFGVRDPYGLESSDA